MKTLISGLVTLAGFGLGVGAKASTRQIVTAEARLYAGSPQTIVQYLERDLTEKVMRTCGGKRFIDKIENVQFKLIGGPAAELNPAGVPGGKFFESQISFPAYPFGRAVATVTCR